VEDLAKQRYLPKSKQKRRSEMDSSRIEITEVFVGPQGQGTMDDTLQVGVANEIVVRWKAGAAAVAGTPDVNFQIEVWNITKGTATPLDLPWSPVALIVGKEDYLQIQPLPPASLALNRNCMNEIHVCLHVAPNVVSFAKSPVFFVFP
jgi:hypothetical protein